MAGREQIREEIIKLLRDFHALKKEKLGQVGMREVIGRKNPYLLRVWGIQSADDLIDALLESTLSASDETTFGAKVLEPLAIFVSGGEKSATDGVDIEFRRDGVHYAVAVKSGPNVFNHDSRRKQSENFNSARRRVAQKTHQSFFPVVGYCYGRPKKRKHSNSCTFEEYFGIDFWTFLSGDNELYKFISNVLDDEFQKYSSDFKETLEALKIRWKSELFQLKLVNEQGTVDWQALTEYVSADLPRTRGTTRNAS
jgi:hypothetical protein